MVVGPAPIFWIGHPNPMLSNLGTAGNRFPKNSVLYQPSFRFGVETIIFLNKTAYLLSPNYYNQHEPLMLPKIIGYRI